MTTLNAKANTAYNDLIAKTERENPGDVWAGFDGDQDAFETGYEAGYEAAQPVALGELSDAVLMVDTYDVMEGDVVPERDLWAVVNAARKALEGAAPQPVASRSALISTFLETFDKGGLWDGLEPEAYKVRHRTQWATVFADAVLALLNGGAK